MLIFGQDAVAIIVGVEIVRDEVAIGVVVAEITVAVAIFVVVQYTVAIGIGSGAVRRAGAIAPAVDVAIDQHVDLVAVVQCPLAPEGIVGVVHQLDGTGTSARVLEGEDAQLRIVRLPLIGIVAARERNKEGDVVIGVGAFNHAIVTTGHRPACSCYPTGQVVDGKPIGCVVRDFDGDLRSQCKVRRDRGSIIDPRN